MQAREIMTRDPAVVLPDDMLATAADLMRTRNVGSLPVVRDRASMHLEGVLTDRDIAIRCVADHPGRGDCRVRDHMTRDHLATAAPDTDAHEVVRRMERQQVRRIPIVDAHGRVLGIVAQADIARRIGPQEPKEVEELLEQVSQPTAAHASGSIGSR
jgi:CBS domain-containing protein